MGIACGLGGQNQNVFHEQTYLYSAEQEFVTPHKANDSTHVQCGVKPEIRIKNREPLQETLYTNDTFTAGDFPVTIIRATGGNGVFSGEGYVQVPYLLDTKIKVKFDGIKINTERQLFEGKLVTSYDETEQNVFEIKSWEQVENTLSESLKAQEQIIKEVTDLEKKYAENKLNSQEFQIEIEEKNKKWQEEIAKNSKIIDYVITSPAILTPEREKLLEQQKELSENINLNQENLKKVKENTKQIAQISKNVKKKHQNNVAESKKKLDEFSKRQNICGEWRAKKGKFGRVQIDYIAYQECTYGMLYRLENNVYIYQTNYNLHQTTWSTELGIERFYIYASDLKTWVEFVPDRRKFQRDEMPEEMKKILFELVDFWIPLENGTILLTGKNLDGEEKNRVVAAGLFLIDIPTKKILKLTKAGKGILQVVGEGSAKLSDGVWKIIDKGAEKVGKKVLKTATELTEEIVKNRNEIRQVLNSDAGKQYAKKYFEKVVKQGDFEKWYIDVFKKHDLNEPLNFEVHHIIPIKVLEKNKALQDLFLWAEQNGKKFDFNGLDNGIPLQKKRLKYEITGHANHPNYDKIIGEKINEILAEDSFSEARKFNEIQKLVNTAKNKLEIDVLLGNKDVNQIINF